MRFMFGKVALVFLLLSGVVLAVENTAPSNPSQERRVTVLISATDGSGNAAQGLSKEQLAVLDNNTAGKVLDVRKADALPLRLGFILLASSTNFGQQQAAAIEIARKVLRPNIDRAFVITARGDKMWSADTLNWQNDVAGIETAIRSLDKNSGFEDPFQFEISHYQGTMNRTFTLLHYSGMGERSVFAVLWQMMKNDPTPARHVVVAFRDPWAHSQGTGAASREYTEVIENNHLQLISDAQQLWTPFLIIGLENPPSSAPGALTRNYNPTLTGQGGAQREYDERLDRFMEMAYGAGRVNVQRVADETGGKVWWSAKKNFADAVPGIVNLLNSQFVLTYSVPTGTPTVEHALQIKATSPSTHVNVQKVYFSRVGTPTQQPPSRSGTAATSQGAGPH